jgi:hypothetical protein
MARWIWLAALTYLSPAISLAGSWTGTLVDAKCYASEERNVNPTDTLTAVDRDTNLHIRYCAPTPKTKAFALLQHDGLSFTLDAAGNAKAAELVRLNERAVGKTRGSRPRFAVAITGSLSTHRIQVDSISIAP